MTWYLLISVLFPILGFGLGFLMGRDHESRQHAQRRAVNER
jgi:hypothetical protein